MSKFKIFAATMMVCVLALGGVFLYKKRENEQKLTEVAKKLEAYLQKTEQELQQMGFTDLVKFSAKLMPNEEIEIRVRMLSEGGFNFKYDSVREMMQENVLEQLLGEMMQENILEQLLEKMMKFFLKKLLEKMMKFFLRLLLEEAIPDWKQCKKRINVTFRLVFCHEGKVFYSETYAAADL